MCGIGVVEINYVVTIINTVIADGRCGFGFAFSLLRMDYGWARYCEGCWNWERGHNDWRVIILVCGRWWCILASLIHAKNNQFVSLSPNVSFALNYPPSHSFVPLKQTSSNDCIRKLTWITLTPTPIPPIWGGGSGAGPCIGSCCSGPAHSLAACLFQCSITRVKSSGLSD